MVSISCRAASRGSSVSRVESDDVACQRQRVEFAHHARVALRRGARRRRVAQQPVEVAELAALALLPHPDALAVVPAARPVQQVERVRAVGGVQFGDAALRMVEQRRIVRHRFGGCVLEVGEQPEAQVLVAIGEETHLERLGEVVDGRSVVEQRRHDDERGRIGGQALAEIHARQRARRREHGHEPVDERDAELAGADHGHQQHQAERRSTQAVLPRAPAQVSRQDGGDEEDRAEVGRERPAAQSSACCVDCGPAIPRGLFEGVASCIDQVVADVRPSGPGVLAAPAAARATCGRIAGEAERQLRHLRFGPRAASCDALDDHPVTVARAEIHRGVRAPRVRAQQPVDHAHRFDEIAPVDGRQEPQAADRVAERHLVGRLTAISGLHELLDREAVLDQALLDPAEREHQRRVLALQVAHELRHERRRHRRIRTRHVGDHEDQALRILLDRRDHPARPFVRDVAIVAPGGDAQRDATDVLDQREAQHDRDGPQLAELEARHLLVRREESTQVLERNAPVAVSDRLESDVVDAREACRGAATEARQLATVVARQVASRGADLLLDQVEVVEQPLARRRHVATRSHRVGQLPEDPPQDFLVVVEAWQQLVPGASLRERVRAREEPAVLLHLLGTEELRPQRSLFERGGGGQARRRPEPRESAADTVEESGVGQHRWSVTSLLATVTGPIGTRSEARSRARSAASGTGAAQRRILYRRPSACRQQLSDRAEPAGFRWGGICLSDPRLHIYMHLRGRRHMITTKPDAVLGLASHEGILFVAAALYVLASRRGSA